TQDGNQRARDQWIFTKYDALNRPVATGIYSSTKSAETLRSDVKAFYAQGGIYFEEFNASGPVHGYSNQSFPNVSDPSDYLTVTYYDNYAFTSLAGAAFEYKPGELVGQESAHFPYVKGLTTGTRVKVLDEDEDIFLWSATYYDLKSRDFQAVCIHALSNIDRTTNSCYFPAKITETITVHNENTAKEQTVARKFDYDHAGRL